MLTRRETLRGGTATVAVIAAGGAVAANATDDSAIEEACRIYWAQRAEYWAILTPGVLDEDSDAKFYPMMDAYDDLMALPAASLAGLAIKAKAYREEIFPHVADYMADDDIKGLLDDIERLAGELPS